MLKKSSWSINSSLHISAFNQIHIMHPSFSMQTSLSSKAATSCTDTFAIWWLRKYGKYLRFLPSSLIYITYIPKNKYTDKCKQGDPEIQEAQHVTLHSKAQINSREAHSLLTTVTFCHNVAFLALHC